MNLEGRIWKSETSRYWLAEVQDLDILTEGFTRRDAADMPRDAIESLVNRRNFRVRVTLERDGRCKVGSNDDAILMAFMLRRLREREGLSVREVARRLGAKSPNAYGQYETGRVAPGVDTLSRLLAALNPTFQPILRVA
jgi:hypothetical protein